MKMEELILLGTGNANVIRCYNTCFALRTGEEYFLIDAGGGNGILRQLDAAQIPMERIHHIFLSHEHTDHLLGMVWMIRMIAARMKQDRYDGTLHLYMHSDLVETLLTIVRLTVQQKFVKLIGERILLHPLEDGDTVKILDSDVTFFDIRSQKAKQYGFMTFLPDGRKLVFAGDEPYRDCEKDYVEGADWLLHEAFCLDSEKEEFRPYEKSHTTVKDACRMAERLGVRNLILYHTEDKNYANRKELYLAEGRPYFSGNLYVPYDLERFVL